MLVITGDMHTGDITVCDIQLVYQLFTLEELQYPVNRHHRQHLIEMLLAIVDKLIRGQRTVRLQQRGQHGLSLVRQACPGLSALLFGMGNDLLQ